MKCQASSSFSPPPLEKKRRKKRRRGEGECASFHLMTCRHLIYPDALLPSACNAASYRTHVMQHPIVLRLRHWVVSTSVRFLTVRGICLGTENTSLGTMTSFWCCWLCPKRSYHVRERVPHVTAASAGKAPHRGLFAYFTLLAQATPPSRCL